MSATYDHLVAMCGPVPESTVVVPNPKYEHWVERAAVTLCIGDHDLDGHVCMPCSDHLRAARRIAWEAGA